MVERRTHRPPALRAFFNDAASAPAGRLVDRNPFAKLRLRAASQTHSPWSNATCRQARSALTRPSPVRLVIGGGVASRRLRDQARAAAPAHARPCLAPSGIGMDTRSGFGLMRHSDHDREPVRESGRRAVPAPAGRSDLAPVDPSVRLLRPADILSLQRLVGNQTVVQRIRDRRVAVETEAEYKTLVESYNALKDKGKGLYELLTVALGDKTSTDRDTKKEYDLRYDTNVETAGIPSNVSSFAGMAAYYVQIDTTTKGAEKPAYSNYVNLKRGQARRGVQLQRKGRQRQPCRGATPEQLRDLLESDPHRGGEDRREIHRAKRGHPQQHREQGDDGHARPRRHGSPAGI
jgi:hypothetical protein